jgi:DNA processing protein
MEFATCAEKRRLERAVGDVHLFQSLRVDDLSVLFGRRLKSPSFDPDLLLAHAEEDLRILDRRGIGCRFMEDVRYPSLLREIYDPPYCLFVVGSLQDDRPRIGVVGTRSPSADAASAAGRLGRELAAEGVCVVSGLARGIDTLAHRGAVSAGGAHVAVLGSGIDYVYPAQNRSLARKLLDDGGAVISEYPPGAPPTKYHFPERNRIISGLSRAVVVVQAPEHSGALITADFALEQGRDLLVHADGVRGAAGAGTAYLVEEGAPAVRHGYEVLEQVGLSHARSGRRRSGAATGAGPSGDRLRMVPRVQSGAAGKQLGLELIAEMKDQDASGETGEG